MKAEQIKGQRWEDIVFESRNKAYGAYFIRREYSKHVVLGCIITLSSILVIFAAPYIAEWIKGQRQVEIVRNQDSEIH